MSTYVLLYFVWKWLRAVKIYYHAKFRASSSKIEQVMANFVLPPPPPVTNLPVEMCASRQLKIIMQTNRMTFSTFCSLQTDSVLVLLGVASWFQFHFCVYLSDSKLNVHYKLYKNILETFIYIITISYFLKFDCKRIVRL